MLKPITVTAGDVQQSARAAANENVGSVFKVLHGFYGNLFLSKFATGSLHGKDEKDADGKSIEGQDKGVISARGIWGHGLRDFDLATVKTALQRCLTAHPEFPPTLPQFVALCAACRIRVVHLHAVPAIGMGQPLRSQYAAAAREIVAKYAAKAAKAAEENKPPPTGLDALKQAIADAVRSAGGNEAAELRRLDLMFAGSAA